MIHRRRNISNDTDATLLEVITGTLDYPFSACLADPL